MKWFLLTSGALTRWIGVPASKAWMWLTGSSHLVGSTLFMLAPLFVDLALAFQRREIVRSTVLLGLAAFLLRGLLQSGVPTGPHRPNAAVKSVSFAEMIYRFIAVSFALQLAVRPPLALVGVIPLAAVAVATWISGLLGSTMWLVDNPTVRSTARETLSRLAFRRPQLNPQPVG